MKYIVLAIIAILLLASCTQGGTTNKPQENFRTGTGSLTIALVKDALPAQLKPQQDYELAYRVTNVGGYDMNYARFVVVADDSVVDLTGARTSFNLHGRSNDYPKGEEKVLTFPITTKSLPPESQSQEVDFIATACYTYQTIQVMDVCMDTDPYNERAVKKVCSNTPIKASTGGGPLNVELVQPTFTKDVNFVKPSFVFKIKKPSNGIIYGPGDEVAICDGRAITAPNPVGFSAYISIGGDNNLLRCEAYTVKFDADGYSTIKCTMDEIDMMISPYKTTITTQLDYGYVITQNSQVMLTR
jgi:hypothetical protein